MEATQKKMNAYAPERCGLCGDGAKREIEHPCPACNGKGTVMVHQPPLRCPRCNGNGRAKPNDDLKYRFDLCVVCLGTGWVMTELH